MHLEMFAIYDKKAGAYLPPFFLPNVAMAVRTFCDCVTDDGHQFGKHPEDYSLHQFGSFDQTSGLFEDAKDIVITGLDAQAMAGVDRLPYEVSANA